MYIKIKLNLNFTIQKKLLQMRLSFKGTGGMKILQKQEEAVNPTMLTWFLRKHHPPILTPDLKNCDFEKINLNLFISL